MVTATGNETTNLGFIYIKYNITCVSVLREKMHLLTIAISCFKQISKLSQMSSPNPKSVFLVKLVLVTKIVTCRQKLAGSKIPTAQ